MSKHVFRRRQTGVVLSGRSVTAIDILASPSLHLTALETPSMESGYAAAAAAAIPTATASPRGGAKPPMWVCRRRQQ
jgi:hypothetical protein